MSAAVSVAVGGLSADVDDECGGWTADQLDTLAEMALSTLEHEGVLHGQLYIALIDSDAMADLNMTHMGHEGPTDVLSFPMDADEPDVAPIGGPPRHLGDIVICPDVAIAQAPTHAGSAEAEFALLMVHGVLHILGHDHLEADEIALMQGRERVHLKRFGFEHPEPVIEG